MKSAMTMRLDARHSPVLALPHALFEIHRGHRAWSRGRGEPQESGLYDDALRWLAVSDRLVSDEAARALLEVKAERLHVRQGHARWATYLRAFVPMSPRWCQQEMRRVRLLRDYPALTAAWEAGALSKSHLRVILRVVTSRTEDAWLRRASACTVLALEEAATEELASKEEQMKGGSGISPEDGETVGGRDTETVGSQDGKPPAGGRDLDESEESRPTKRVVMAPPGVAALVSEAVDLARKMASYQIGVGAAVEMMAMETIAGLHEYASVSPGEMTAEGNEPSSDASSSCGAGGGENAGASARRSRTISLGDHADLRREMGAGWELLHRQMEAATGRWRDLPSDLHQVLIDGAPDCDADAHQRVVFWTGLQGRLDAVRGRLLRIVEETFFSRALGFAGFGQYVRERLGLSLREAQELVRIDRALERLPAAFRMYASGRLGRRAAWLLTRVATSRTDRAWVRFAMSHTLRLLEVVVEGSLLKREVDPAGWKRDGGLPPQDATFAGAIRACAHFKAAGPGGEATARVEFILDSEQKAAYETALRRLRDVGGRDRPEWWGLAVMARHFLNCYADEDSLASPAKLRRMLHRQVIERDNYTCRAPECLQRGGLEADHMVLRSRGGPTTMQNMISLCAADHRFMKHQAGTLAFSGAAPESVTARMGARTYFNDRVVDPEFIEATLDQDPWVADVTVVERVS